MSKEEFKFKEFKEKFKNQLSLKRVEFKLEFLKYKYKI